MSDPKLPLTVANLSKARPGDVLRDAQIPGLEARVKKRAAVFCLYYRTKAGRERRPKIGDARVISIPQARDIAKKMLAEVALGGDPSAKNDGAGRHTLSQLADWYMERHANVSKKPKSALQDRQKFDGIILPALGADTAVADVKRADIATLHHNMRRTPYHANRTIALLHHAFELAEVWGWREEYTNPVRVTRYAEPRRKRVPTKDEACALLKAMDEMRQTYPAFVGMLDILIFTGARPGEIRLARREWLTDRGLELPDAKTGSRLIPFNEFARAAADALPVIVGNPYLIPGARSRRPLGNYDRLWKMLCKNAGLNAGRKNAGLVVYDLKRYFASAGISGGVSLEQIGQLMGHTSYQTTRGYAYLMEDAAVAAAQRAGEIVKARLGAA